jgi:uncharacterized membrane protein YeaQ/YmgE (transglycosylase-associated protein family)
LFALYHGPNKAPAGAAARRSAMSQYLADHGWLWWIVIGAVAGAIAKMIMPGRDPSGCIVTIILGIAGAVLAGFLGQKLNIYQQGQGAGFIAAIVGAVILLAIYRMFAGRRS